MLLDDLVVLRRAVNDRELQGIGRVDVGGLAGGDPDARLVGLLLRGGQALDRGGGGLGDSEQGARLLPDGVAAPVRVLIQPTLVRAFPGSGERNVAGAATSTRQDRDLGRAA